MPFDSVDQDCKGGDFQPTTCKALHLAFPALGSNPYNIDVDGPGGSAAVSTWCDMTTDGGGWTLASYSYAGATSTSASNVNARSLQCTNGTWAPTARSNASASLGSVVLAQSSTEMAIAMTTNGANVATGGIGAYQVAWKLTIPNPSKVHFKNHGYTFGGNWNTTDAGVGPCVPVTVQGIVGDTNSYSRYILQNVLGVSWTDSYPGGYGAGEKSSCVLNDTGPFVTSVHSGVRDGLGSPGGYTSCDTTGSATYTHRGNYTAAATGTTGGAAIWFR